MGFFSAFANYQQSMTFTSSSASRVGRSVKASTNCPVKAQLQLN